MNTIEKNETEQINLTELLNRIVAPRYFAEATRDSGYKGTHSALAELLDNCIQAKAQNMSVYFEEQDGDDVWVYILDDGTGMNAETLAFALQFGGSSRFGNRDGIGRFGMGLPNASVSQCRRVEVYTRQAGGQLLYSYLDLDQLSGEEPLEEGFMTAVSAKRMPLPDALIPELASDHSGTLVIWKKCDRLYPANLDALKKKVSGFVGQAFRKFLYPIDLEKGIYSHVIKLNGTPVRPFDPLYLHPKAEVSGAEDRGTSTYDIQVPGHPGQTSPVTVRYSVLPVEQWQTLPKKDLESMRVFRNRGFSVVRAGREIEIADRFFLRNRKGEDGRITNNDAWWSCEISFDPTLDEVFGVTHTKQDIRPNVQALQKMVEEITVTIGTLRNEYDERRQKKTPIKTDPVEDKANRNDQFLPPAPASNQDPKDVEKHVEDYVASHTREGETKDQARERVKKMVFTLELESAKEGPFYRTVPIGHSTIVFMNTDHAFYKEIYAKLDEVPDAQDAVKALLFALARGERSAMSEDSVRWYITQRAFWSQALQTYLGK